MHINTNIQVYTIYENEEISSKNSYSRKYLTQFNNLGSSEEIHPQSSYHTLNKKTEKACNLISSSVGFGPLLQWLMTVIKSTSQGSCRTLLQMTDINNIKNWQPRDVMMIGQDDNKDTEWKEMSDWYLMHD